MPECSIKGCHQIAMRRLDGHPYCLNHGPMSSEVGQEELQALIERVQTKLFTEMGYVKADVDTDALEEAIAAKIASQFMNAPGNWKQQSDQLKDAARQYVRVNIMPLITAAYAPGGN